MKGESSLSANKRHAAIAAGLLAMAVVDMASANAANGTYNWSAELVSVDETARTVTVQARRDA